MVLPRYFGLCARCRRSEPNRGARRVNSEIFRALEVRQHSQAAIRNRCDEWQYLAERLVQGIDRSNVLNSPDIIPCPREFPIPQPLISYLD